MSKLDNTNNGGMYVVEDEGARAEDGYNSENGRTTKERRKKVGGEKRCHHSKKERTRGVKREEVAVISLFTCRQAAIVC